jgi:Rieske Fe-S protein
VPDAPDSRRGFLKAATIAIGGTLGAVLAIPLFRVLVFPLGRKTVDGGSGELIDVAAADAVKRGAPPLKVPIVAASVRDGWARRDALVIGSAYLTRTRDDAIQALSSTCPHLGCPIAYEAKDDTFRCPCHKSAFARSGKRIDGPSKRGLDPLEVTVEGGRVKLRFVRYRQDVPGREPV